MKLKFIGDIHFGKKPSHSTRASAHRHSKKVDRCVDGALGSLEEYTVQMGDLFDSYVVNNTDFVRGLVLASKLDMVIRGNHDYSHNNMNRSALSDVGVVGPRASTAVIDRPVVDTVTTEFCEYTDKDVRLHVVPYMPTQTEFLQALSELQPTAGDINVLCLHTNMYAEGFSTAEVENNLTAELARQLADDFDLVVSGHEHNRMIKHGVHMVGSIFPHNFGDISTKTVLIYDTETHEITYQETWSKDNYAELGVEEFLEVPVDHGYDFIEVTGEVKPENLLPVVKHMGVLMNESVVSGIKNKVKLVRALEGETLVEESVSWETHLKELLTAEQFELFTEVYGE